VKVASVVGARPQFVKLAPIAEAAAAAGVQHTIVHTGQHYDPMLSDVFFDDLGIPRPDVDLGVGSGSHGVQTGAMLSALDGVFESIRPDCVLVYGDTNSTLAAAISAVKMHLPVAHLEAGLRSYNRRLPEEHNRVLTDHAADLCLAPTEVAMQHLATEGLAQNSVLVGDVMTDVLYRTRDRVLAEGRTGLDDLDLPAGSYRLATIHRPDNTDDPERLNAVLDGLAAVAEPVVLLAHPRLVAKAAAHGIRLERGSLVAHTPLGYPDLVAAATRSAGIITDSGGLQKEAFLLRVPCVTVRTETEWPETLDLGWNVLVDDPAGVAAVVAGLRPSPTDADPYGDGNAASRAVAAIVTAFSGAAR
jgi:UDP-N-acetylglucosamine 2-epimerase (non-hydrolysing)